MSEFDHMKQGNDSNLIILPNATSVPAQEIRIAIRTWSNTMQQMLDQKFGPDKVGHLIVLFPFDAALFTGINWVSNATRISLINLLNYLLTRITQKTDKSLGEQLGDKGHFG